MVSLKSAVMVNTAVTHREDAALSSRVLHQAEGDWEGAALFCSGWDQAGFTEAVGHRGFGDCQHHQRPRPWRQSSPSSCRTLWRVNREICAAWLWRLSFGLTVCLWFVSAFMWRWGRSSISQIVSWGWWHRSMKSSARPGPESELQEGVTSAPFPATVSPGARQSWWGLKTHRDGHNSLFMNENTWYIRWLKEQSSLCVVTSHSCDILLPLQAPMRSNCVNLKPFLLFSLFVEISAFYLMTLHTVTPVKYI